MPTEQELVANEDEDIQILTQSEMIVDQVSEAIDAIPEDDMQGVARNAKPSQTKFPQVLRPSEDHDMPTVEHNSKLQEMHPEVAYMTNSRMMRDQLILPSQ